MDSAKHQVYFTLSSTVQNLNLIQRVDYSGSNLTPLFTASGGVQRCTALALDFGNSQMYLSDAGTGALWKIPFGGGSAAAVLSGLTAVARKVQWYDGPANRPAPGIAGIALASAETGATLSLHGTDGYVGGTYYILMSTNLAAPLSQWVPISTNVLAASGDFILTSTNAVIARTPDQFYVLEVQ